MGRALLAHPEFEKANAEALRSIDAALETLERPFTRGELQSLALRYLGADEARELTDAVIGLAGVLELGDSSGSGSRWLASYDLIVTELGAFGRAAALAARSRPAAAVPDLGAGYSAPARELLGALTAGPDLVLIDAYADPATLLEDVARLAERLGRMPVSIAHGSGSAHPQAVIVPVRRLAAKPVSNAIILVDQADALSAAELDIVVQAALAGNCQLVLVRRPEGPWPRSRLLDLLAPRALQLNWGQPAERGIESAAALSGPSDPLLISQRHERALWTLPWTAPRVISPRRSV